MRFRTKQRPRGLITHKHQLRLTLMLVTLGLVLIGSRVAGRAEFWAKLFPDTSAADNAANDQHVVNHATFRPGITREDVRVLREDLLNSISDNQIGVSSGETAAWFVSMELAGRLTETQILGLPKARYAQFMDAPGECRGRAWKLTGTLRRLTREKLTNNSAEYDEVIDAWLTLPDSGDGLVHVVARSATGDLPFGTELAENAPEVTVSGYFFKREAYASGADGGLSIAPLVLAGTIAEVQLPNATGSRADQLTPWLIWLAIITCAALGLVVWSFVASDAVNRSQRSHQLTRLPVSPSFEGIRVETPHETLLQLETTANADERQLPDRAL
ncbi:MAG: hypothetical protein MK102_08565 [Fuerstiella sp.]|nr:hypothetical protein [Fuerstiella sp.]